MSTPISLIQMPNDVMEHILEYLDFLSILILRKVCHDLRNFIDDIKPASRLTKINVNVLPDSISFEPLSQLPSHIDYEKKGGGCVVKYDEKGKKKEKLLENVDFVTVFCKDFDIILRHQKTVLDEFEINTSGSNMTNKKIVLESVLKSLKSRNHPLQVKYLFMGLSSDEEIMTILPYMDSKLLERIRIHGTLRNMLNLDEIGQLEQWKQAKELEVRGFQIQYLSQYLKHFSKITFWYLNIPAEKIILLKEIFRCSSTLNIVYIFENYSSNSVMRRGLIEAFGEPDENSNWFFKIADTNQFLRISCKYTHIYFKRIEQSDVPQNARISN